LNQHWQPRQTHHAAIEEELLAAAYADNREHTQGTHPALESSNRIKKGKGKGKE
jgi:hypothetical protein